MLKTALNFQRARRLVMVGVGIVGLVGAYIDRNITPIFIALFGLIYLATEVTSGAQSTDKGAGKRLAVAILVALATVGTFNYVVNPFGLYPPHFFEPLTLTTRDFKMKLYTAYKPPPQAVVIGSSRSFGVDPNQIQALWHYSAFNASVTVGTMREYLAFLRYFSEAGKLPDLLIINVAPEAFRWFEDSRFTQEPNARLWDYIVYRDPLFFLKDGFYRMTRLFAQDQAQASARVLQAIGQARSGLEGYVADANGMMHFRGREPNPADLDPETIFLDKIPLYFGTIFTFNRPNDYQMGLDVLQQILELAKQNHMEVIGYMPPYHPAMRDVLEGRTAFRPLVGYLTGQLDNFEQQYPFHYANFIDAAVFSTGESQFYDLIHPNEAASAVMMEQLYEQFQ